MIVLETPRLWLQRVSLANLDALCEAFCDAYNMRFFPKPFSRDDLAASIGRTLLRYAKDGVGKWVLVVKETGEVAGDCGLMLQQVDGVEEMEVGYVLARRFQGRGYATEAAKASMVYAFETLHRDRVISLIHPANAPSRRVAERNGMIVEKETVFHDLPHLVYARRRNNS